MFTKLTSTAPRSPPRSPPELVQRMARPIRAAPKGRCRRGVGTSPVRIWGPCAVACAAVGRSYDTVRFLSDYGLADEFVGVVKAVHPRPRATRRGHRPDPQHRPVRRARRHPDPGPVHLVPADRRRARGRRPGCRHRRRALAIEVADGEGVLLGPDNGLLAPAVALAGGAERACATNTDFHLPAPGRTFAGRDIFAPVARPPLQRRRPPRARRGGRPCTRCCPASSP